MKKYSAIIENLDFVVEANSKEEALKEIMYLYMQARNIEIDIWEISEE